MNRIHVGVPGCGGDRSAEEQLESESSIASLIGGPHPDEVPAPGLNPVREHGIPHGIPDAVRGPGSSIESRMELMLHTCQGGVPRGTPDLVRGTRHRTWNTAWDPTSSVEVHTEFGIAYAA